MHTFIHNFPAKFGGTCSKTSCRWGAFHRGKWANVCRSLCLDLSSLVTWHADVKGRTDRYQTYFANVCNRKGGYSLTEDDSSRKTVRQKEKESSIVRNARDCCQQLFTDELAQNDFASIRLWKDRHKVNTSSLSAPSCNVRQQFLRIERKTNAYSSS